MRRGSRILLVSGLAFLLAPRTAGAVDEAASGERLGVRAGYIGTFDGLREAFGDGWDMTLFFTERLYASLFLDVRIGAAYLGEIRDPARDDEITNTPGIVTSMRFLYFSVGPIAGFSLGQYSGYASAGIGIYSASVVFEPEVPNFSNLSDQHVGFNGGIGLSRRLSTNWSLELNGTVHYFSVDQGPTDLYWVFTDGADDPLLLGIAVGAALDLR